ncbi:AAA family ATPase [Vibrio fluvialis]|uniref:ParA family protein n=1 Tax=Vibrio fluvialis TaxID=676 RepID=UPI001EEA6637|nr:ParA family protein [Vibrio fluvialis]MCG6387476.1 AAA family ATPase [Vibrio fluvialis]MCG6418833.1 AAA family ATPase [Vibrio fluvialis]
MITARKGGVTKTTLTVNLAYCLSKRGKKVLVIDLDSQADTSKFFRWGGTEFYIGDALLDRKFDIKNAIYKAKVMGKDLDNLDIIVGRPNDEMTMLDRNVFSLNRSEDRLAYQLKKIEGEYDFVLIDTPPTANTLSMNATMACDEFLFPSDFTEHSLDGIEAILEHIQDLKLIEEDEVNFFIVPSRVNRVTTKTLEYGKEFTQTRFPDNTTKTIIWKGEAVFNEAERRHLPIAAYKSSDVAAMHYNQLAQEILDNDI